MVIALKTRAGRPGREECKHRSAKETHEITGLCQPPRLPTSKAHTGGPPPAPGAASVLVHIPSPFLPVADMRDPWGPAVHASSSPRSLSSTSGPCCHGNSSKAGSFLQGQPRGKEGEALRGHCSPLPAQGTPAGAPRLLAAPLCGPSRLRALTPRAGTGPAPPPPTTVLNVLRFSDSQASWMLTPPLPSSSHLCIQQMFTGHLISTGLRARCQGYGGNQGSCPCHLRAQGGQQQPPPNRPA